MTLVKLDNGDYINTLYVIKTMTDTAGSVGKKNGQLVYLLDTGYQKITPADRDHIAEAMNPQKTSREFLVKEMLIKAQAIADLSAILNYTDGGIDVAKALRGISDDLSRVANA